MLATKDAAKSKVPIWFTEIGEGLDGHVTLRRQAEDLVKSYTLAIAQGVSRIDWFEAQEGGYRMGVLDRNGAPTPAYITLANLTRQLGAHPVYKGWLLLNDKIYAFHFQGPSNTVMAAWAPPNTTDNINLGQPARFLNPVEGIGITAVSYTLSNAPVLVISVPTNLVSQAEANRSQPVPWGGNFSQASFVSVTIGTPNREAGLHQLNADTGSTIDAK